MLSFSGSWSQCAFIAVVGIRILFVPFCGPVAAPLRIAHRLRPSYVARVKLSVKSDYAARAVLGLARDYPSGTALCVEVLAAEQHVPRNYLVQILIELKAQGIVRSIRGKEGGYLLARPPAEITLADVLRAVDGAVFDTPALTDSNCSPELRRAWERLQKATEAASASITFQKLLDEGAEKEKMYYI
jgi:Rrf2 family transcriptional regulator, cysteine metabolism repressor